MKALAEYNVLAQHPDTFLLEILVITPGIVVGVVANARAALKNPARTATEYLETLRHNGLQKTATFLQNYIDRI